jgi:hypothetical protein
MPFPRNGRVMRPAACPAHHLGASAEGTAKRSIASVFDVRCIPNCGLASRPSTTRFATAVRRYSMPRSRPANRSFLLRRRHRSSGHPSGPIPPRCTGSRADPWERSSQPSQPRVMRGVPRGPTVRLRLPVAQTRQAPRRQRCRSRSCPPCESPYVAVNKQIRVAVSLAREMSTWQITIGGAGCRRYEMRR